METETEPTFTVFQLAGMVDVSPSSSASAGGEWLASVAASWLDYERSEAIEYGTDLDDAIHAAADSSVPIYYGPRWSVFTDLGAWQLSEEVAEEYGKLPSDMTDAAGVILYWIAERLIRAIESEIGED